MKVYRFSAQVESNERFNSFDCAYCTDIAIITDDETSPKDLNKRYNGREGIIDLGYTYAMNAAFYGNLLKDCHLILDDIYENKIIWLK